MKSLYKWLTLMMAVLVLLGNIGVGLIVHHCMMKGTSVSWAAIPPTDGSSFGCSIHPTKKAKVTSCDTPTFQAKSCCTDATFYEKVDIVSLMQSSLLKISAVLLLQWIPDDFYAWIALTRIDWDLQHWVPALLDLSPPLLGRCILVLVQSFLI